MKETLIRLSFLFVLSTVHEDVWKVLKRYSSMLVVEVIPWALPGHLFYYFDNRMPNLNFEYQRDSNKAFFFICIVHSSRRCLEGA